MATSAASKASPGARTRRAIPIVLYMATSLDGTSFALDPVSQRRIHEAFPGVRVSTRHLFIAHDTREALAQSLGRFEDPVLLLLTGVSASDLAERFGSVSFRNPKSQREVLRVLGPEAKSVQQDARRNRHRISPSPPA